MRESNTSVREWVENLIKKYFYNLKYNDNLSFIDCKLGNNVKIHKFCNIYGGNSTIIGENCLIGSHVTIQSNVVIGSGTRIGDHVFICSWITLGNNVFVSAGVNFCNDLHPKAFNKNWEMLKTVVEDDVSIGANATILPGITLGKGCKIGAGAVVVKSVPPNSTQVGNPARPLPMKIIT